ncbi:MAG: energy-coupling factor transporter transmembrane component T [Nitrospirota bacterium]
MRPQLKIALYCIFVLSLFLVKSPAVYIALSAGVSLLLLSIPYRTLKRGWIPICLLLTFTYLGNLFFHYGKVVADFGILVLTEEGIAAAGVRTMRLFLMIAGAKMVIATTPTEDLVAGLEKIFKPLERLGIPVAEFFSTMELALKSLPRLRKEAAGLYREKVKDGNLSGFRDRAKVVSQILSSFFIQSLHCPERFFTDESKHAKDN